MDRMYRVSPKNGNLCLTGPRVLEGIRIGLDTKVHPIFQSFEKISKISLPPPNQIESLACFVTNGPF